MLKFHKVVRLQFEGEVAKYKYEVCSAESSLSNGERILKNIMEILANLLKMCGVEIDYWGYQDPMAERYGFLEITTLATFLDATRPTTFSKNS